MFIKLKWYRMLPDHLKPKNEMVIESIERLRKKYELSHENISKLIILTPWTVKVVQEDCLRQGRILMPHASEKELWKGVLLSNLNTKLASLNVPTGYLEHPLSEEEILSLIKNIDTICVDFKSFSDVIEFIISIERKEGTFSDPSGILDEVNFLLESNGKKISSSYEIFQVNPETDQTDEILANILAQEKPSSQEEQDQSRDDDFIAYNNGTVLDKRTNLMWAARDNGSDINWVNAKSYCENYRGGGYTDWRMPTHDELAQLHDSNKTQPGSEYDNNIHMATELIHITGYGYWSSETRGSDAFNFDFNAGFSILDSQSYDDGARALPVRFVK